MTMEFNESTNEILMFRKFLKTHNTLHHDDPMVQTMGKMLERA